MEDFIREVNPEYNIFQVSERASCTSQAPDPPPVPLNVVQNFDIGLYDAGLYQKRMHMYKYQYIVMMLLINLFSMKYRSIQTQGLAHLIYVVTLLGLKSKKYKFPFSFERFVIACWHC